MLQVRNAISNYFNAPKVLSSFRTNSAQTNFLATLKVASYLAIGAFAYYGVKYTIQSLAGRSTSTPLKSSTQKTQTNEEAVEVYKAVNSSTTLDLPQGKKRSEFMKDLSPKLNPVIVSKSSFVSDEMVEHLMRHKKDSAISEKYSEINFRSFVYGTKASLCQKATNQGDPIKVSGALSKITNMEGALHTFVTPVVPIVMTGDYLYSTKHSIKPHQGRQVVLSAAIHPDFEFLTVMMKLVEVTTKQVNGESLSNMKPLWSEERWSKAIEMNEENKAKKFGDAVTVFEEFIRCLDDHEAQLQAHMVYHLTEDHRLPPLKDVILYELDTAINLIIEKAISSTDSSEKLKNVYVKIKGKVISLEVLFNIYIHQVRNEFTVLENTLSQGYVYTIDPPIIFAKEVGAKLLNRLQILAFKFLKDKGEIGFKNLKIIGFNDFADNDAIPLFKKIFGDTVQVRPKKELFSNDGYYSIAEPYALVLHNNSDAFGQNIETELEHKSMDGIIGNYSDAAVQLKRDRKDLLDYVHTN